MGGTFSCSPGSTCCGDTCAKTQDKCCTDARGTKYAVSGGSPCIDELKNCTNRHGKTFFCGTVCAAPGSWCCKDERGAQYAVAGTYVYPWENETYANCDQVSATPATITATTATMATATATVTTSTTATANNN